MPTPGASRGEAGAATVLVVAMVAVLLLVGCALAGVVGLLVEHRRAQSAADLAALAGATARQRGQDACAAAAALARRNGARVARCGAAGPDVTVLVSRPGPAAVPWPVALEARARAGPGGAGRARWPPGDPP